MKRKNILLLMQVIQALLLVALLVTLLSHCKPINYERTVYKVTTKRLDGITHSTFVEFWHEPVKLSLHDNCIMYDDSPMMCNVKSFKAKKLKLRE